MSRSQARADLLRLLHLLRPGRRWMAAGAGVALVALLANIGLLATSGEFIARMALAGAAGVAIDYFTPAALIRGFAIARTGGRYVERLVTHEATLRLLARLRVWFYLTIEPLAPSRLEDLRAADLLSRIQADIDTLDQAYLRLLVPALVGAAAVLAVLAAMALYAPAVAASTSVLLVLVGVGLPAWAWRRGAAPAREALALRAALRVEVADALAGAAELRAFDRESDWARRIDAASDALLVRQRRLSDLAGTAGGAAGLGANLALWSALVLLLPAVAARSMAPAHLAMLALLALAAFEAVAPLPAAFRTVGEVLAAARRIFELVDCPPPVPVPAHPAPLAPDAGIEIRGLRLRYGEGLPWVLDGLDLDLASGRRLALTGVSGAGKSSLVHVLTRLRDFQAGSVRIGGTPIGDLDPDAVRRSIAVVSQDDYLFNASILDNLLLARPDASESEVVAACRAARIHDDILAMPEGYGTALGESGTRLSGGQARRLSIARALLKDAPVLVLDEPAEGLDVHTERELYAALDAAVRGRSVLLISHRLGALAGLVDEIACLEQGRLAWRRPLDRARVALSRPHAGGVA